MYIINFIRGFIMAIADSVPGVSGGTIAFIMGFYDNLINSINSLIYGSKEERLTSIIFLLKIGFGWTVGIVMSILFITSVFEENIYSISSLFLGLIIMAIPLIIKQEQKELIGKYVNILFTIGGFIIVFLITYFNPIANGGGVSVSLDSLSLWIILFVVIAGMIAISAMVLPGISGSTILLILGLYSAILNSIKEVITLNLEYLPIVIFFGIGILLGILITIKGVRYVLSNYRSETLYTIIGLMLGSLYAVIMGPMSLEIPKDPLSLSTFSISFFIIGVLLILGLEQLKKFNQK